MSPLLLRRISLFTLTVSVLGSATLAYASSSEGLLDPYPEEEYPQYSSSYSYPQEEYPNGESYSSQEEDPPEAPRPPKSRSAISRYALPASSSSSIFSSLMPQSSSSKASSASRISSSNAAILAPIVSSSSSSLSMSSASSDSSSSSDSFLFDRETFGYGTPVIDPEKIVHPQRFSFERDALIGNSFLSLLFALIVGITGLIFQFLMMLNPTFLKEFFRRLPLQAALTILLLWLLDAFIPSANAQGFSLSTVSLYQIPFFAFIFFLVIGSSNVLFNNILQAKGSVLHDMLAKPFMKYSKGNRELRQRVWFMIFLLLLYGIIGSYINPSFSLTPMHEIGVMIITISSIILSNYLKDWFLYLLARKWRWSARFQGNVGGLVIVLMCVLLGRMFSLSPGFIYGVPVSLLVLSSDPARHGLFESLGQFWLLVMALVSWVVGSLLWSYEVPFDLFNLLYVLLIELTFLELLPLPYLAGGTIFGWKRLLWFIQFSIVTFFLFHTLWNPSGTVMSLEQSPPAFAAVLLLGCYAVGVFLLWGWMVWWRQKA